MSRSSTRSRARGQTEPLAALLAVAVVSLAVAAHAGVLGSVLPGQSERTVVEATTDQVWDDIREDGVYRWGRLNASHVENTSLPAGRAVYVNVTRTTSESASRQDAAVVWGPEGEANDSSGPPERARVRSRPIPIRVANGTVTTGRLWVAVWDP
jgi:hypothetical protein